MFFFFVDFHLQPLSLALSLTFFVRPLFFFSFYSGSDVLLMSLSDVLLFVYVSSFTSNSLFYLILFFLSFL